MRVYLDNNVWVDIENGIYSIDAFKQADAEYFFSDNIIEELLEASGNVKVSPRQRLELIDNLCGDNFILIGVSDRPNLSIKHTAFERFSEISKPLFRCLYNCVRQEELKADHLDRKKLQDLFGINKIEMNNKNPQTILSEIEPLFKKVNINDIDDYLSRCEAQGRTVYTTLFNLLDYLGYRSDKKTERSAIARLADASHAYCSQVCDVLITSDKRMMVKANAVYAYFGVSTRVVPPAEFFNKQGL